MPPRKRKPLGEDIPLPGDKVPTIDAKHPRLPAHAEYRLAKPDFERCAPDDGHPCCDSPESIADAHYREMRRRKIEEWDLTEDPRPSFVVFWEDYEHVIKKLSLNNREDVAEAMLALEAANRKFGDPYGPRTAEWTDNLLDEELEGNLELIANELHRRGLLGIRFLGEDAGIVKAEVIEHAEKLVAIHKVKEAREQEWADKDSTAQNASRLPWKDVEPDAVPTTPETPAPSKTPSSNPSLESVSTSTTASSPNRTASVRSAEQSHQGPEKSGSPRTTTTGPERFAASSARTAIRELDISGKTSIDSSLPSSTSGVTRFTSETGGSKEGKLARFDQIPTYPLWALAEHYGAGNAKYPTGPDGIDNWRKGYPWSLSFAAMMRHAQSFWAGEDIDAETGHSHLTAVAWHAFALLEWARHPELVEKFDDRQNAR